MQEETLSNSNKSLNSKKAKNKINAKTSSTNIDSNSQKYDSNYNSNSEDSLNYSNRDLKNEKNKLINLKNYEIAKNSKKNYIYLPINELKQFKTWNSSNLNAIYQNIIATDQENYLHIKPSFTNHLDITEIHRTILVDWLINVHLYFKLSDECLYLTIKLIDIFLARTINFTKNKLQLLGICSLQISSKYIEGIHPSINNLSDLCDKCYTKKEIIQFEKYLLQINNYIIEQNQLLNYYDLLCLILKFNIKYYYFGKMLLDLTLLDINFYKYQKNVIIFAICSLIIYNLKMIDELTDDFEIFMQECKEGKYKLKINDIFTRANSNNNDIYDNNVIKNINYLFSFFPSKDYHLVTECAKIIIDLYENAKMSKYNSAIQKLFIQLKEIKIEAILEQPREISNEFQPSKNEEINRSYKNEEESDEDINMIIID
jgi:hypothetical protein